MRTFTMKPSALGVEARWRSVAHTRGIGAQVSRSQRAWFPHFRWMSPVELAQMRSGILDFVLLAVAPDDVEDWPKLLADAMDVVRVGGRVIVAIPPEAYFSAREVDEEHKRDMLLAGDVDAFMAQAAPDWAIVDAWQGTDEHYCVFRVYERAEAGDGQTHRIRLQPSMRAAVIRYGAIGDMIQASSIFPGLAKQGYAVEVFTNPQGEEVIRHDPHVYRIHVEDRGQVPVAELGAYWKWLEPQYDHFINLSSTVESTFLALPSAPAFHWPHAVRHRLMNVNYSEFTHDVAGVPFEPAARFYPTAAERMVARDAREGMHMSEGAFVIVWALAGSAPHKIWPYWEETILRLVDMDPGVHVVTVGDRTCRPMEAGLEHPRIHPRAGAWTVRETLTFAATQADMVIGPETGVLSAVMYEPTAKIVFLSHSSRKNLTEHWINTVALSGRAPCYPCHRKITMDWAGCMRNEELGAAQCQVDISPDSVVELVAECIGTSTFAPGPLTQA